MAEYCEYLWDPLRGHTSLALAHSLYDEQARINRGDKKLAVKTVRAILRDMPGVDLTQCTDEYITRFLLARKYRTEQAAALIVAYQSQIAHRQDIFGNLTARDPALQRALRAGIPGVLPARDNGSGFSVSENRRRAAGLVRGAAENRLITRGRNHYSFDGKYAPRTFCSAGEVRGRGSWESESQERLEKRGVVWVGELWRSSVEEVQEGEVGEGSRSGGGVRGGTVKKERGREVWEQSGFVAVVDWSNFSLRQGGALGAAALRNLVAALRGRFPARFKAIHFLSAPLYVQATLALIKPFLDEKTRSKIYLHGNNLSTLHEHLPTDILPAELGGSGPAFNPGLWAEPVIHSAMKEAELAAMKRDKDLAEAANNLKNTQEQSRSKDERQNEFSDFARNENQSDSTKIDPDLENKKNLNNSKVKMLNINGFSSPAKNNRKSFSLEPIYKSIKNQEEESLINNEEKCQNQKSEAQEKKEEFSNGYKNRKSSEEQDAENSECSSFQSDTNSNEFEMVPSQPDSEESSLEIKVEKIVIRTGNGDPLPEEANLIT
ncbi:uncharacterized protein LOC117180728 [Belonocnema kinseyi]|uniref:uncharacterized protein LOC117180728 n=1 Tax=Belonocnema kinseyi TaxID=2817044 RepID=UPI00143DB6D7|nr:uncharacterized protein LOC117180728 [Belonocnema kinseyi]